jgi:hypothetical protein
MHSLSHFLCLTSNGMDCCCSNFKLYVREANAARPADEAPPPFFLRVGTSFTVPARVLLVPNTWRLPFMIFVYCQSAVRSQHSPVGTVQPSNKLQVAVFHYVPTSADLPRSAVN